MTHPSLITRMQKRRYATTIKRIVIIAVALGCLAFLAGILLGYYVMPKPLVSL